MIKVYVYHKDNKIYQVRYQQDGPNHFSLIQLDFETVPTYEQIEAKFYEVKGE